MIKLFSFVQQGGDEVVTNSQRSSTKAQQSFPGATVTVYYTGGPQGLVTTNGVTVTWVQGTLFNANPGGWTGLPITINGTVYTISAVSSIDSLTLTSSAGVQAVPVAYSMGATTPAALYSDNTGTPRSNPYTSDSTTAQQFMYADNGTYDFPFLRNRYLRTIHNISPKRNRSIHCSAVVFEPSLPDQRHELFRGVRRCERTRSSARD